MKIAITNNTGLRNRGCEALVVSLIDGIERCFDTKIEFDLHSNDPTYDRWRLSNRVKIFPSYLTLTPNHFKSLTLNKVIYNFLGIAERFLPNSISNYSTQQLQSLYAADLVLPTGGDIITSDYGNLRKHLSSIVSLEKRKAALIAHTIGPFTKNDENYFKRAVDNLFLITVRETESFEYLKSLNLDVPLHLTADVAFNLKPASAEWAESILRNRFGIDVTQSKLVGLSVSEGVIRYSKLERARYFDELNEFVKRLNTDGYTVLLIPHVMERNPNNNDLIACEELHCSLSDSRMCRVMSGEFTAAQFKGIIGLTDCLLGARTHATIASMSQGIPTVSIAYSRKAYGIMSDVFGTAMGGELTVSAADISADKLESCFKYALSLGKFTENALKMKALANKNFDLLNDAIKDNFKEIWL